MTPLERNYEAVTHLFGTAATTWAIYLLVYFGTMVLARLFCRGQAHAVAAFVLTPAGLVLSVLCAVPFLLVAAVGLLRELLCSLVTIECVRTREAAGTSAFRPRDEQDSRAH